MRGECDGNFLTCWSVEEWFERAVLNGFVAGVGTVVFEAVASSSRSKGTVTIISTVKPSIKNYRRPMETITTHWKTITNYDILNGNTSIKTQFASSDSLKEWFTITYNKERLMWFSPLKVFNLLTFSHPSPSGKLKRLTSLLSQHFKPVTTRIERCIKITVRPSSFYVTTSFITGFQVPVDTYGRKLYITRTLQPNDVEKISVAQNDRAITGFPPPLSDQDSVKNFSSWNSPTEQILQLWFLPFTKGRKN